MTNKDTSEAQCSDAFRLRSVHERGPARPYRRWTALLLGLGAFVAAATNCTDVEDRREPSRGSGGAVENVGGLDLGGGETNPSGGTSDGGAHGGIEGGSAAGTGGTDPGDELGGAGGTNGASGAGGAAESSMEADCDHVENGDTTSTTDLSHVEEQTSDSVLTICGKLEGDGTYLDYDHFQFPIAETGSYAISLVLSEPIEAYALSLRAYLPNASRTTGNGGSLARVFVPADSKGVGGAVIQFDSQRYLPEFLNTAIAYKLRIRQQQPPPCEPVSSDQAAYAYTESNDGPEHTGNDVLRRPDEGGGLFAQFVDYPSEAESSGIVIRNGERSVLHGQSALLPYPPGDFDRDRDTFLIRTGDVTRLTLRLETTALLHELSVVVFERDKPWPTMDDWRGSRERHAAVLPNQEYWIWIGGRLHEADSATPYSITICGEKFEP
jgi:hypothetical protein